MLRSAIFIVSRKRKTWLGMRDLGTRVHDSGLTTRTGKITKAGRRDLRVALVEAAHVVAQQPSALEGGAGTPATAAGLQQSDRGDRAQVIGDCLACAGAQSSGPFCRTGKGLEKDCCTGATPFQWRHEGFRIQGYEHARLRTDWVKDSRWLSVSDADCTNLR